MPVLKNPKHEHFAQGLAKGMTQEAAYVEAGYSPGDARAKASRLLATNGNIATRVAELQQRGAIRAEVTIASLIEELEEARLSAKQAETVQASAMVSASLAKAKLLGLVVDRQAGADGGPVKTVTEIRLVAAGNGNS